MNGISPDSFYSVAAVVLVLGGLIFIHELGHFVAAKWFRVGVKTFSLGFGPKLFGFTRNNTQYQVAVLPLGGFVSMVGEQDPADIPAPFTQADSFALRPAWQRLIVVAAGPLCNLFLAWLLYTVLFMSQGQNYLLAEVGSVQPGTPAMAAGIQAHDRIVALNGKPAERWDDLLAAVMASEGRELTLTVDRGGVEHEISVTPAPMERKTLFGETKRSWGIGVIASMATGHTRFSPPGAAVQALKHSWLITKLIGESVVKLFERVVPLNSLGGPIQIVQEIHTQAQSGGLVGVLLIAAFISLNLGLLNLLPIPVLDGGHILFMLVEIVRGKPAPERFMEFTTRIGIALLLALMLFATYNDLSRWLGGPS